MTKLHDGEVIDTWEVELQDDRPLERLAWLKEIDRSLCDEIAIAKTDDGRFLLVWEHRHPELGTYDEHFETDPCEVRDEEELAEWQELREALTSKKFSKRVTRKQAWETLAYFSLDEEWFPEIGL